MGEDPLGKRRAAAERLMANGLTESVEDRRKRFDRKLKRAAREIREEAQGRICGTCRFYQSGGCQHIMQPIDDMAVYHPPEAVACGHHEERPPSRSP